MEVNKEFSCSICEKNCPTKDSLERHFIRKPLCKTKIELNSVVPLEKKVLTRWCNVMSIDTLVMSLGAAILNHTDDKMPCAKCGKLISKKYRVTTLERLS